MSTNKERRFLFDNNNFDLPDVEPEPEIVIEPPPMFTLEELGIARDEAFAKGRAKGLDEARVSREQYLAEQAERIAQELKFLTGAESYRAAVYEREAVALTETIFKTLYPFFTEREGLEEIKAVIAQVIANQPEQSSIVVELPAEDSDAIQSHFAQNPDIDPGKISFKAVPNLARASCRLSWKDGGALRDHQIIADEILKTLQSSMGPAHSTTGPATDTVSADTTAALAKDDEKDETEPDSQGD